MMPAREDFEPDEPVLGQLHERLVVWLYFVRRDRPAHVLFQRDAFPQRLLHAVTEETIGATAFFLGAIHRHVGGPQQRI